MTGAPPGAVLCVEPGTNTLTHVYVATVDKNAGAVDKPFYVEVFQ